MKWTQLYQFQVESINAWFDTDKNLLLMANTAGGKTEAAFLPIISSLASDQGAGGIRVLYVGPLKALINDQFRRLEELCHRAEIPVHRWHGDVDSSKKQNLIKKPSGILLITPESLESLLMKLGHDSRRMFLNLQAVVIDELHVFLDSERGRQLGSLLNRIDSYRQDLIRTRKVGLSATIGDVGTAQRWLAGNTKSSSILIKSSQSNDVELLIKTFIRGIPPEQTQGDVSDDTKNSDLHNNLLSIANHLLVHFNEKTNLVFCNRKTQIEELADYLAQISKQKKLSNQFLVHHGSLSKQFREFVEDELKSSRPCTAICSSTLELGIDIGEVDAVGQIGPPHSVSSLKQRMGRSGRREGRSAKLYLYVPVEKCDQKSSLPERLYPDLLQSLSLVLLMLGQEGIASWIEPPVSIERDYSTLIQQILSIIVEKGGIQASSLFRMLSLESIFGNIAPEEFSLILKSLGENELIEQVEGGDLILGLEGEKLVSHYEFYAVFETPRNYQVVSRTGAIGEVEGREGFYQPDSYILLGGKRWKIVDVDERQMKIIVEQAKGKKLVQWHGTGGQIHEKIREIMYQILQQKILPNWLETNTKTALNWAIQEFQRNDLASNYIINEGNLLHIFTWTGSRANHTLYLVFRAAGLSPNEIIDEGVVLTIQKTNFSVKDAKIILSNFINNPMKPEDLCCSVFSEKIPPVGKYGEYLTSELKARAYSAKYIDINTALKKARLILEVAN
ncbi:MAG: DEAD/DEAH box helicase [Sedimentisphaerales bacterium]